jgi:Nuclear transport factor 2 (NTF2) domain
MAGRCAAVARHFCKIYYAAFNRGPDELYKMYDEKSSCYTYGWEGNEKDETYTGRTVLVFLENAP